MKITKYILPIALAAFAACSDDSTSAKDDSSSSNTPSSSTTVSSSSSKIELSSSSVAGTSSAAASSSGTAASSSSSKITLSSSSVAGTSSAVASSSSTAVSSSSAIGNSSATVSKPEALFTTRVPDSTELNCSESGKIKFSQADWICSFNYGGKSGYFYVQSTPKTCEQIMSATAVFSTDKAQLYLGGSLITLSSAQYDWGGNHKNDYITFTYDGKLFKYYHSSFGFGWRSCQEMDCLQVYKTDSTTVIEDGCTSSRTLPVVCRQANADGSFGSFTDTFARCAGDDS